jgi:hypothetical protein
MVSGRTKPLRATEAHAVTTDQANVAFWNALCGSYLARSLGIYIQAQK